ncbi:hypothetical protein EC991_010794 [Linnemannia zychae]|nr:hypothetical protein EC991_010794 [Linnemannia zychae]
MHFSAVIVAVAALAASFATGAPGAPKPRTTAQTLAVLNYALTLEHLQDEFYKQGLAKFNETQFTDAGFDAKVRSRFVAIGEHESEHVAILTSAIGSMKGKPVPICNYSFPMDNLTQFLAASQVLENMSVSAYLGAASGLSGDLLTAAAAITTAEARHASYLNELWGQSGLPYAYDTPLGPREIVTLATKFITSCPYDLGVKPFTQLTASLPAAGSNSTMITTSYEGEGNNMTNSTYCQFLFGNNVTVSPRSECALPENVYGYVYVLVTKNKTPFSTAHDSNVLAGPTLLFNSATPSS